MKHKNRLFRRLLLCCSLVIVILVGSHIITQIYAYFIDEDKATNQMIIGGSNIKITEDFEPPKEVIPGVCFKKDVKVKNLGPNDCYVRIKAVFSDSDMGQYCTVDWNETEWVYDEADGYYYYKQAIVKGKYSTSLFTTITIMEDTPENVIKDFDIIVYAESYQAEGFDTYVEAWNHYKENKPK